MIRHSLYLYHIYIAAQVMAKHNDRHFIDHRIRPALTCSSHDQSLGIQSPVVGQNVCATQKSRHIFNNVVYNAEIDY